MLEMVSLSWYMDTYKRNLDKEVIFCNLHLNQPANKQPTLKKERKEKEKEMQFFISLGRKEVDFP